jgi:carbon storage regulator CsrA
MLILWRKVGECIWINDTKIKIEKVTTGGNVRLAIDPADSDVFILRDEVKAKMKRQNDSVPDSIPVCDGGCLA